MRVSQKDLRETHILGGDTPQKIITPKVSPLMDTFHSGLAGVSDAGRGYCIARRGPPFGHVLACFSGGGKVLVDGAWQACGPEMAYLTPPDQPHAYHTVGDERWGFAWVWWHPSPSGQPPLIDCGKPTLIRADAEYLRSAILGLYRESIGPAQPTVLDDWVELVHAYAARLNGGLDRRGDRSLIPLWERVDMNLSHPWTVRELADVAAVSGEHLRRLCQRQTGRGPMHHVAFLRMRRAAGILESTRQKVGAVGHAVGYAVGYENAFAFSTTFKRHLGVSPAAYRRLRGDERRPANAVCQT